ncbi:hypothetical protein GF312_06875 [Candidatus Poribacteria bacterium]|nr:hypothetical protein [Candidatus Poribacteria bacterium]
MIKKSFLCLMIFTGMFWSLTSALALPDLAIDSESIGFSDNNPTEGDPMSITAKVINKGDAEIPDDIEVRFIEGDPEKGGLQISFEAIILGLKAGESKTIDVKWRAASGKTDIHVIADPENEIKESNEKNNYAIKPIEGKKWKSPKVNEKQINETIKKAAEWIKSQQGEFYVTCPNGHDNFLYAALAYGKCVICGASLDGISPERYPEQQRPGGWMAEIGPGMTSLMIMTLLHAGVDVSDPAIEKGFDHLFNKAPTKWEEWTDPYDFSTGILALTATGNKEKYMDLVQYSVNRLEALQTEDGGWGYGTIADAAHLQYVMFGLYAAKQWGAEIKPDTWTRAVAWLIGMQQPDGGWNYYSSGSGPYAECSYGSMTATAVMSLKAAGLSRDNKAVKRGVEWLERYYSITRNPGTFYWHYYYLVALQRAMDIPPKQEKLGSHDWYQEIASFLVKKQQEDGSWIAATPIYTTGAIGQAPEIASWAKDRGDLMATSFAVLFLTRAMPEPAGTDVGMIKDKMEFSKSSPDEGEEVTIKASVINQGSIPVENLEVKFYDGAPESGGVLIAAQPLPLLSVGQEAQVKATWKAVNTGEHKIYAVIDPSDIIQEFDEKNNIIFDTIIVGGEEKPAIPAMVKLGNGLYKLGKVDVDLNSNTIKIHGKMNMSYGLIELLACSSIGKVHESAIVLDVDPIHLQTALILMGLEYEGGLRYQGDPQTPKGDRVYIWVEWNSEGQVKRHRAEDLVFNREKQSTMPHVGWVFSGSRINDNGVFMAQAIGTIITTFHDPDAIIDNPLPEGADDTVYIVNTKLAPPKGTDITMIITPVGSS